MKDLLEAMYEAIVDFVPVIAIVLVMIVLSLLFKLIDKIENL